VDTPQIDDFLLWAATIVVAVTAIAGGLVALYRLLTGALNKRLDDISSQLRRNGGTSLRDAVDRIDPYDPTSCLICGKKRRVEYCRGHEHG
jgi:hypothetical protein